MANVANIPSTRSTRQCNIRLDLDWGRKRLATSDLIGDANRFAHGDWAIMDRHRRKATAAYAAKLKRKANAKAKATNPPTQGFA